MGKDEIIEKVEETNENENIESVEENSESVDDNKKSNQSSGSGLTEEKVREIVKAMIGEFMDKMESAPEDISEVKKEESETVEEIDEYDEDDLI